MVTNTGKEFEKLVESIYKNLIKDTRFEKVEHNVKLKGPDGERQIDILITAEMVGLKILTIIECKDFKNKVSVTKVDEFHSKLKDVHGNKGIIISAKGFSSTAIAKAKRLGITLCTAQEAMSEKWAIDMNIPIVFKELRITNFTFSPQVVLKNGMMGTTTKFHSINGTPIQELITKSWKEGTMVYVEKEGMQKVYIPEIEKPYMINLNLITDPKLEIEATDFEILINLEIKYFETTLKELEGTKILNNIIDEKATIFFDIGSITKMLNFLKQVKKISIKNGTIFIIKAKVTPNFGTKPSSFQINKFTIQ